MPRTQLTTPSCPLAGTDYGGFVALLGPSTLQSQDVSVGTVIRL